MIDILPQIAHNYIAQAAFWGWFTAQAIKFVWQLVRHGKFRPERLVGSGGTANFVQNALWALGDFPVPIHPL